MGTLSILPPTQVISLAPDRGATDEINFPGWNNDGTPGGNTDAGLVGTFNHNGATAYYQSQDTTINIAITFGWLDSDAIFVLDGGAPKTLSQLPSGFLMRGTITLSASTPSGGGLIVGIGNSSGIAPVMGMTLFNTISGPAVAGAGSIFYFPSQSGVPTLPITSDGSYLTAADFLGQGFQIFANNVILDVALTPPFLVAPMLILNDGGGASFWTFAGDYTLLPGIDTLVYDNLTLPNDQNIFRPGDEVRVHSSDPTNPFDLTTINAIHLRNANTSPITITVILAIDFLVWTNIEIIFIIPPTIITLTNPTEPPIQLTVLGTQFSGEVPIGPMIILTANGSGIYKIVPGLTHDTLHVAINDPTTVDYKFPDPFAKTGFIGG